MMIDTPRLVLDANIMVSALLGTSFALLLELMRRDVELLAPEAQLHETRTVLTRRARQQDWADAQVLLLHSVIDLVSATVYSHREADARLRLHARGQPDWPVLAVSLATGAGIWSHDKDFFGAGAPVWSTFMLKRQLAAV